VPFRQQIADILAAWRTAERRHEAAAEGSAEREAAAADVARLRDEYQRMVQLQAGTVSTDPADDGTEVAGRDDAAERS
jgi:hypothetical protein